MEREKRIPFSWWFGAQFYDFWKDLKFCPFRLVIQRRRSNYFSFLRKILNFSWFFSFLSSFPICFAYFLLCMILMIKLMKKMMMITIIMMMMMMMILMMMLVMAMVLSKWINRVRSWKCIYEISGLFDTYIRTRWSMSTIHWSLQMLQKNKSWR